MRVLVIGAGGQVGKKFGQQAQSKRHEVIGAYKSKPPETRFFENVPLDKTKKQDVERVLSEFQPQVVVDTGALHNVDYCEMHPDEAMAVNRDGTNNVASISKRIDAKFIFISTDYVFDGNAAPYSESDAPNPESVYAKSKLQGEQVVLAANEWNCVCRPSVIYSWAPPPAPTQTSSSGKPLNFAAWFVSQVSSGKDVNIVTDQIASPTLADDLAGALLALAENETTQGVYHTAGTTAISRYDFAVAIARKLGLNESLIHPTDSSRFKQNAKRPLNSSLVSNRIRNEVGYQMMTIEQALVQFARQRTEYLNSLAT